MRFGGTIESFVNSEAESKLGLTGGAEANLGNTNNPLGSEAEKFVYKNCMQLQVA